MRDRVFFGAYDLDKIGKNGAKWVKNFSVENMALKYENAYLKFLSSLKD